MKHSRAEKRGLELEQWSRVDPWRAEKQAAPPHSSSRSTGRRSELANQLRPPRRPLPQPALACARRWPERSFTRTPPPYALNRAVVAKAGQTSSSGRGQATNQARHLRRGSERPLQPCTSTAQAGQRQRQVPSIHLPHSQI